MHSWQFVFSDLLNPNLIENYFFVNSKEKEFFFLILTFSCFADLKQENQDLHTYIGKLVSRVMISCPEVLAADDDLKMPARK